MLVGEGWLYQEALSAVSVMDSIYPPLPLIGGNLWLLELDIVVTLLLVVLVN